VPVVESAECPTDAGLVEGELLAVLNVDDCGLAKLGEFPEELVLPEKGLDESPSCAGDIPSEEGGSCE